MLPESSSDPVSSSQPPEPDVEPISPAEAERVLQQALDPYLADGWRVLDRSAYGARLTRGMRNLDVRVDLLGHVETQETSLTPLQESGRLTAWVLLLAALFVAFALAAALGII